MKCNRWLYGTVRCDYPNGDEPHVCRRRDGDGNAHYFTSNNMAGDPLIYNDKKELKTLQKGCSTCKDKPHGDGMAAYVLRDRTYVNPRYGYGRISRASLMVVEGQPPEDPEYRQHGCFALPYKDGAVEMRPCDYFVRSFVFIMRGLKRSDVYSTRAVKCAIVNDMKPCRRQSYLCSGLHLARELETVKPDVILTFGDVARDVLLNRHHSYRTSERNFRTFDVGYSKTVMPYIEVRGNMINAPHPSCFDDAMLEQVNYFAEQLNNAYNHVVETTSTTTESK